MPLSQVSITRGHLVTLTPCTFQSTVFFFFFLTFQIGPNGINLNTKGVEKEKKKITFLPKTAANCTSLAEAPASVK